MNPRFLIATPDQPKQGMFPFASKLSSFPESINNIPTGGLTLFSKTIQHDAAAIYADTILGRRSIEHFSDVAACFRSWPVDVF